MDASWPQTPQDLLKQRYNAFVEGNVDFIIESHHPETRAQIDRASIETWAKGSKWLGLVIDKVEDLSEEKTRLNFQVRYEKNFETINHREGAEFRKFEGKWYYYDSEFPHQATVRVEKIGRNDPCSCGSKKKYKKCCGSAAA